MLQQQEAMFGFPNIHGNRIDGIRAGALRIALAFSDGIERAVLRIGAKYSGIIFKTYWVDCSPYIKSGIEIHNALVLKEQGCNVVAISL